MENKMLEQLQYCYISHNQRALEAWLNEDYEEQKRQQAEADAIRQRMIEIVYK